MRQMSIFSSMLKLCKFPYDLMETRDIINVTVSA